MADFARLVKDRRLASGLHLITGGNARSRAPPDHVGGTRCGRRSPHLAANRDGAFYKPWLYTPLHGVGCVLRLVSRSEAPIVRSLLDCPSCSMLG